MRLTRRFTASLELFWLDEMVQDQRLSPVMTILDEKEGTEAPMEGGVRIRASLVSLANDISKSGLPNDLVMQGLRARRTILH